MRKYRGSTGGFRNYRCEIINEYIPALEKVIEDTVWYTKTLRRGYTTLQPSKKCPYLLDKIFYIWKCLHIKQIYDIIAVALN